MTVVKGIPFRLNKEDVLRGLGIGNHWLVRSEIDRLIDEMLMNEVELKLIQPAIAYDFHRVIKIDGEDCFLEGDTVLHSTTISKLFPQTIELAVAVATIGPNLEARVTEYFKQNINLMD